jgi:hypothetical protein
MSLKLLIALALNVVLVSNATADEVVRWVDENRITHFCNAKFAPPGRGEAVGGVSTVAISADCDVSSRFCCELCLNLEV